jgi:hypothetical protein
VQRLSAGFAACAAGRFYGDVSLGGCRAAASGARGVTASLLGKLPAVCGIVCCLAGCAAGTAMDRLMPHVETLQLARHYFGEPGDASVAADGAERREWLLDRVTPVPGQDVHEKIFMGYDRDGYPVYFTRAYFVPEHAVRQRCRLTMLFDQQGRTLQSSWEGDSCDELLRVPSTY